MNCIIVDDEPLARAGIALLIEKTSGLNLAGSFGNASEAAIFLAANPVDLLFLDIQMPETNGIEFAKTIPQQTLVIFTTAFPEYALNSYDVEAIDYLIKPVKLDRFRVAIKKAASFLELLKNYNASNDSSSLNNGYFFVKADRKIFKIQFEDILFIEALKDYVILQTATQKIITAMNIKTIHEQLPQQTFVRISKSYVINVHHIVSFDNNTVFIDKHEIPIGNTYRSYFFDEFVAKRIVSR